MSTSRPFAYNPNQPIAGSYQRGDLAIGVDEIRYDFNAGGVQWWSGPDEDLGYVIAYPNYAGNQPNPLGISCYVQFWRSSALTEESFINTSTRVTGQSFGSGSEARNYLLNNGYWTSFTATTASTYSPFIISSFSGGSYDFAYSPTNKEAYANNYANPVGPEVILLTGNTPIQISSLPTSGTSSSGDNVVDVTNNKLFTGNVNGNVVTKYDLNTKSVEYTAQPYAATNNNFNFSYNPVHNVVYIANDDDRYVYVLSGSNLSTIDTIPNPTPLVLNYQGPINVGTNTNNGNFLFTLQTSGSGYDYFLVSGSTNEIFYSGNSTSGSHDAQFSKIAFSPISNKFYLQGQGGVGGNTKYVSIIDGDTGSLISRLDLGSDNGFTAAIIYDSTRNYIWTPGNGANTWYVIDCNTDSIVHTFNQTLYPPYGALTGIYDPYFDRLICGRGSTAVPVYFNCGDILPI